MARFKRNIPLHLMMLPGVILVLVYAYGPMFGLVMAFQNFSPSKGFLHSDWVGLDNFRYILSIPTISEVIRNTLVISILKIVLGIVVPVVVTLMLNELRLRRLKRGIQTIIYFPHFLSWIILAGIFIDILSPSEGVVNKIITVFGFKPVYFLGDQTWFPISMILTDTWKEFGYGTIVYLAALSGINPTLYEAAQMDGAGRWKQMWHITLPGLMPMIMLMSVLALGNILNAGTNGFEQIFNLYSSQVYKTGDILDTLVFRVGMQNAQFSVATAIGLFKAVISFIFITTGYFVANKALGYKIL